MACVLCGEQIKLLPGPNEDEWIILSNGLAHQSCYNDLLNGNLEAIIGVEI